MKKNIIDNNNNIKLEKKEAAAASPIYRRIADRFSVTLKTSVIAVFAVTGLLYMLIAYSDSYLNNEELTLGTVLYGFCIAGAVFSAVLIPFQLNPSHSKASLRIPLLLFFAVPVASLLMSEAMNGVFIYDYSPDVFIANYVLFLFIQCTLLTISGSLRFSLVLSLFIIFIFSLANSLISQFRGTPLLPVDLLSIVTGLNVISNYNITLNYKLITGIILLILLIIIISKLPAPENSKNKKLILRGSALAYTITLLLMFFCTDVAAANGFKPDFWNQVRGYRNSGSLLNFTLNTKYLFISEPENYEASKISDIVAESVSENEDLNILNTAEEIYEKNPINGRIHELQPDSSCGKSPDSPTAVRCRSNINQPRSHATKKSADIPNIIVIMNETLSDLRILGEFETNKDYMPYIRNLTENTIKGNLYLPVHGAGTSNSEFEFLTGNSMAFLTSGSNAYELYIKEKLPSLAHTLKNFGYSTNSMHPYYRNSWHRADNYPLLGFDNFTSIEDILGENSVQAYRDGSIGFSEFQKKVDELYPEQNVLLRGFISDSFDHKFIERMYEEKETGKPFFMFNVTMQNHGGYDYSYANFRQEIRIISRDDSYYPDVNRYLSLIYESDKAVGELVNYFSKIDEPTLILIFGDHQPSISTEFTEKLLGNRLSDLSLKEKQKLYVTPFMLWANYDIPEGYVDRMSSNYLSSLLLQTAELPLTDYGKYLCSVYKTLPVIDTAGYIAADGKYYSYDKASEYDELLSNYRCVAYNALFGKNERNNKIFYPES